MKKTIMIMMAAALVGCGGNSNKEEKSEKDALMDELYEKNNAHHPNAIDELAQSLGADPTNQEAVKIALYRYCKDNNGKEIPFTSENALTLSRLDEDKTLGFTAFFDYPANENRNDYGMSLCVIGVPEAVAVSLIPGEKYKVNGTIIPPKSTTNLVPPRLIWSVLMVGSDAEFTLVQ